MAYNRFCYPIFDVMGIYRYVVQVFSGLIFLAGMATKIDSIICFSLLDGDAIL